MQEKIKRRKDEGFTLVELMIVIAVIGILAVVLVPKVGSIKTQAKDAGLDTNIRVVEGYVQSKIDKWVSKDVTAVNAAADIVATFSGDNTLTNPFTSVEDSATGTHATAASGNAALFVLSAADGADSTALSSTATKGTIVVSITETGSNVDSVTIRAHGLDGAVLTEKTVTIEP